MKQYRLNKKNYEKHNINTQDKDLKYELKQIHLLLYMQYEKSIKDSKIIKDMINKKESKTQVKESKNLTLNKVVKSKKNLK